MALTVDLTVTDKIGQAKHVGRLVIINTADHDENPRMGNYRIEFEVDGKLYHEWELKDFDRSTGPWNLTKMVLDEYTPPLLHPAFLNYLEMNLVKEVQEMKKEEKEE